MSVFFSAATCAFYPDDVMDLYIEAGTLPDDVVELTSDEISAYFCVDTLFGKKIGAQDGRPVWVDLPPKTTDELIADAAQQISSRLTLAAEKIAPLQDAVELGIATDAETASLTVWKTFRVLVNRVTSQAGYPTNIDWPTMPE